MLPLSIEVMKKKFKQREVLIEKKDVKDCSRLGLRCYDRQDDMQDY